MLGEFPVKFFGTNDFYWVTIGRTFAFAEGDEEGKRSGGSKALQNAYAKGVEAAITVIFCRMKKNSLYYLFIFLIKKRLLKKSSD